MRGAVKPRGLKDVVSSVSDASTLDVIYNGDAFKLAKNLKDESIDFIFSSPPYCMGKEYESSKSVEDFVDSHEKLLPELCRALRPGGSICWQVGYHVKDGDVTPLDFLAHGVFSKIEGIKLRNRIIWSFDHGQHATKRFSGRHEVVLWYSKGESKFDLDAVRVPQKYPGKKFYRGPRKGEYSGNPLGKNPGDVWVIPNVNSGHAEKTIHPCQFPVALPLNLIKALSGPGDLIFDPFMGVGSAGVAAALVGRRFLGSELQKEYIKIAKKRIADARAGKAVYRPLDQPILEPKASGSVSVKPPHFRG